MSASIAHLASPRRREILRLVWSEEREAGAIHRALGDVTFGAVSQHLRRLEDAGLVGVRTEGRLRFYRARPEPLGAVADALEALGSDALYKPKVRPELGGPGRGPRPRQPRRRARRKERS